MRSFTTKTHIGLCIALCALFIFSMLLAGCGSSSSTSDEASSDTGSIAFSVVWPGAASQNAVLKAAKLSDDCTGFGVRWVKAQVLDENDKIIAKGPRTSEGWPCDAGKGTITGVPVGDNRKVVVFGMDSNWNVLYKGESLRKTVVAGPNFAGTIMLYPVNIWFVDGDMTRSGGGKGWAEAFRTIDEAIDKARGGYEIWVKEGKYSRSANTGYLVLDKAVAIYGGFAGWEIQRDQRDWQNNETTVDGASVIKCFYVTADAIIDGFTITGASGESGIYNGSGSAFITNCTFSGNSGSSGGGICNSWSSPTITNCIFSGNSASNGGGIYNDSSSPYIANCIFSGNSASSGGGICNSNSSPNIINCTFSGNSASSSGGGICNSSSLPNIINCTFHGNSASDNGGAISNEYSSSANITNCILWEDTAGTSGPEIHNDSSSDATVTDCHIGQNPLFGADLHLQANSPCIDTGDLASAPSYDIDYETRPELGGTKVDIGADEFYDSDDDRMPDYWEVKYDLDPSADDSGVDPDEDDLTNLEEYQNGTSPIDASPTAKIMNPLDGSSHRKDDYIEFKGTGSDPEDGVLTGNSLVWTSSVDGGIEIGTGPEFSTSLSVGTHIITLTATDSQGATGSDEITIVVDHH